VAANGFLLATMVFIVDVISLDKEESGAQKTDLRIGLCHGLGWVLRVVAGVSTGPATAARTGTA
jgi:hypothetical protein